jgi:hypothetical protein
MEISHNAATAKGPAATFTGEVWIDPITRGLPPSPLNVAAVRFTRERAAPGIRTTADRPCTSRRAAAWCRYADSRSWNSIPVMSSSHRTARSTGTVQGPITS